MRSGRVRRTQASVILAALVFIGLQAAGQTLCEYVPPESTIEIAELSFAYTHYDDGTTPEVDASAGRLAGRFERLYDSPDLGYTMSATTQLDVVTWVAATWLTSGSVSYRHYFADELPLFAYAGVRVDAATFDRQLGCEVRAGVGIGRFRDVTPFARTLRIIAALTDGGSIKRAVSSQAMLRIAEQIARTDLFEEFEAYVAAVAEMIGTAVGASLDSAAVLVVRGELEKDAVERYCGAILQAGVGYELVDPNAGEQDVLYVLSGDVGRALSPDSQLRCRLSFSGTSEDVIGENTSSLELSYEAEQPNGNGVRATYALRRVGAADVEPALSQRATVEYRLGVGSSDVAFSLALSKATGDPKWTVDLSISVALSLL